MHFHVLHRDLLQDTRTDDVRSCQLTCFSFLYPPNPEISSINHLNFYCEKTNRLHFSVRVYCYRSQKTSKSVNNTTTVTPLDFVSCHTFCSLHAVTSSIIYYSAQAQKTVIYLFNTFPEKKLSCG